MATGPELTREHQLAQIRNGAGVAALLFELGNRLRAGRLTEQEFVVAATGSELLGFQAATRLASEYLAGHREVEAPKLAAEPLVVPTFDKAGALRRATSTVEALREQDLTDWRFRQITGNYATWGQLAAMNAGRDLLVDSIEAAGARWRRVTDGNPCAFCAMLAGRGPVYRSRETAGLGRRFHERCGCSVEEVVGDWSPSAREAEFADLYNQAVEACDADGLPHTASNILPRMREMGQGVVHDAHRPRTEPKAAEPVDLNKLSMQELEERMMSAAEAGDWLESERIGEILDSNFYGPSGMPVDRDDPFRADVFDAFEELDEATQLRYLDSLGERSELFAQAQWEHVANRTARQVPTIREQRAAYEEYLEVQYVAAENATNGFMLTAEAKAAGHRVRDLWKVNEATARKWATPEMLEYWDRNGRFTWADWREQYGGDMGANVKRSGTWLR